MRSSCTIPTFSRPRPSVTWCTTAHTAQCKTSSVCTAGLCGGNVPVAAPRTREQHQHPWWKSCPFCSPLRQTQCHPPAWWLHRGRSQRESTRAETTHIQKEGKRASERATEDHSTDKIAASPDITFVLSWNLIPCFFSVWCNTHTIRYTAQFKKLQVGGKLRLPFGTAWRCPCQSQVHRCGA